MNSDLISIVVPVYNTEKYLPKCLDSLLGQTYKNLEIICINDGSTDGSLQILEDYAKQDNRIIVLSQENAKQGAARNRGLDIAKGEYVTFVDSDDWIEKSYIELLYNSLTKYNVNMAAASMTRDKRGKHKKHLFFESEIICKNSSDIVNTIDNHFETAGKLYKFDLIKDLRFMEGVFFEDAPYTIRAIHKCGSMVTVPKAYYHYVSNPKSTIKQKSNMFIQDKIDTALNLINYAEENNIKIKDWEIYRDDRFLWKIKHYKYHKDFYLFGLKIAILNNPIKSTIQKTKDIQTDKKVSVIIPCYNQAQCLNNAVESVLNQTYKNIEIVIFNDGSSDNTYEIGKNYSERYNNIIFIDYIENHGVVFAKNTSIEQSSGEYILPLDADDTIEPAYVEKAVKILNDNPNIGIVYCKAKYFGTRTGEFKLDDFNKSTFLYKNCIHNSALFRKEDFIKVGKYNENMKIGSEDFDLWLSFIEQGFDAQRIDEFLFNYRQYKNVSRTKIYKQHSDEVWKQLIKNHINLYMEDETFYKKLRIDSVIVNKKYKKYKLLFNLVLFIFIFTFFIQFIFSMRFLCSQ